MSRKSHLDCDGNNRTHIQAEQVMLVVIDNAEQMTLGKTIAMILRSEFTNAKIAELAGISVNEIGGVFRHMSLGKLSNGEACTWMGSAVKSPQFDRVFTVRGRESYVIDGLTNVAFAAGYLDRLKKLKSETSRHSQDFNTFAEQTLEQGDSQGFYICRKLADEIRVSGFPTERTVEDFIAWIGKRS